MNACVPTNRGRFQGVVEIVAFNWHWYVVGGLTLALSVTLFARSDSFTIRASGLLACIVAGLWGAASLIVSHWVYDRSPLRDWLWIRSAVSAPNPAWCNIHCGLDESSAALRRMFPSVGEAVLDIYDEREMTEASIARARAQVQELLPVKTDFRRLPLAEASRDAVFLLFAAHELRTRDGRDALFREVRRVVSDQGRVIVAEHLRDVPNFCAFGPGAFHFFSRGEWFRVFQATSLEFCDEFCITPFVRVFVLRRTS
jgi:SAM-dependent methyltransferase